MRLNRYIAQSGVCSRRSADKYILDGRVTVNHQTVAEPWHEVSRADIVEVNGVPLARKEHIYIMMNKPAGVTTTLSDRYAGKKIIDLVPGEFGRVVPVGRLDKDSRGLILLTTDGEFCYRLTHPRFEVEKEYLLTVEGCPGGRAAAAAKKGVIDKGELLKVKSLYVVSESKLQSRLRVIISEGKKRHLRRLFRSLGYPVKDLQRVRVGGLRLGRLKEGECRTISREETALAARRGLSKKKEER